MYRDCRWTVGMAQDAEQERDSGGRFAAGPGEGTFTKDQEYPHKKKIAQGYKHIGQLHSGHHVYVNPQAPDSETHVSPKGFNSSHKKGGEYVNYMTEGSKRR